MELKMEGLQNIVKIISQYLLQILHIYTHG